VHRREILKSAVIVGSIAAGLSVVSSAAGASILSLRQPAVGIARRVSLTLSSDVIKPKVAVVIRASVLPREPGRTILLRLSSGKRFRNLAVATTNARGFATFHHAFGSIGTVKLAAEVVAIGVEPMLTGAVVEEQVVQVLPFVLPAGTELKAGDSGALVVDLQRRLTALGYWLGAPAGYFGDATQQAVYAMEKAAGISRSGIVGPAFVTALNNDVVPTPKTTAGNAIDVDLEHDLVEIVQNGQLKYTLNTSTGGGYTYTQDGATNVAITPRGVYSTNRVVNGTVVDSLGTLWRPRFFVGGYAIHGDSYVPSVAVSHGCVRVSNEAIDWIWANNLDPEGETVIVY
jgi:peptidoglycan hydrolase-like protein with peptidoglycan-binding domain